METKQQRLGQYAILPVLFLGFAAGTGAGAQPVVDADVRTSEDTIEYRIKASEDVKGIHLVLNLLETKDTSADGSEKSALVTATKGPTTLYAQKGEEGASAGFSIAGSIDDKVNMEIMPVYLHFDKDGNATGNTVWATASATAGDYTIDSTVDYEIVDEEKDSHAEFVSVKTDDVGVALGRDYAGKIRGDIGFKTGDVGSLIEVTYDQETDQIGGIIMVAQDPGAVTGPKGPMLSQNAFTIGEFSETKTYINGIANKPTTAGFAGSIGFAETGSGFKFTPELGYKTDMGIAGSIGTTVQQGEKPVPFAKISIVYKGAFGEAKVGQDGVVTAYFGISTK